MANPPTPEFLDWVADRFVAHHGESENVSFVQRLRVEAEKGRIFREELGKAEHFYELRKMDGPHFDGTYTYQFKHRKGEVDDGLPTLLYLTNQQATDLGQQLDAAVFFLDDLILHEHEQHDPTNTYDTRTH